MEQQTNKDSMRTDWTIADGFEELTSRIDKVIYYRQFAEHIIPDKRVSQCKTVGLPEDRPVEECV